MNAQPPKQKLTLTVKQHKCLTIIQEYQAASGGFSPSLDEIAKAMDDISVAMAKKYLVKLQRRGWITWLPGAQRSITLL